jgi:PAS domain S-box-containing protein
MQFTPDAGSDSRNLYSAIVEQAPDAMIYADRSGSICIWNKAAEALFGYVAAEAVGRNLDLIIPERFRRAHWDGFNKALEAGKTRYAGRVLTTRSAHKSGAKLYIDMTFALVTDQAGLAVGALAVVRDCTERYLSRAATPRS